MKLENFEGSEILSMKGIYGGDGTCGNGTNTSMTFTTNYILWESNDGSTGDWNDEGVC